MFTFLGVYLWELFTTCDFEWSLIKGRRKFTWPLSKSERSLSHFLKTDQGVIAFFFLTRYCILLALIGLWVTPIFSLKLLELNAD